MTQCDSAVMAQTVPRMGKAWTIHHVDNGSGFTVPEDDLYFITGEIQLDHETGENQVYTDEQMDELMDRLKGMNPGDTLAYDDEWSVECREIDINALESGPEWGGW